MKTAFIASIAVFELINSEEGSPEILLCANSQEQAGIAFRKCRTYSNQIDPRRKYISPTINRIEFEANSAQLRCLPANASRLDGYNASFAVLDRTLSSLNLLNCWKLLRAFSTEE